MRASFILILLSLALTTFAQNKFEKRYTPKIDPPNPEIILSLDGIKEHLNALPRSSKGAAFDQVALAFNRKSPFYGFEEGRIIPVWEDIDPDSFSPKTLKPEKQVIEYLSRKTGSTARIGNGDSQFLLADKTNDEPGVEHLRLYQHYKGVKIYGAEVMAHFKESRLHLINGYVHDIGKLNLKPAISKSDAIKVTEELHSIKRPESLISALNDDFLPKAELVIYDHNGQHVLAYYVEMHPNLSERMQYFIDASNGDILHSRSTVCRIFHDHGKKLEGMAGPDVASERDLLGVNQQINVFEQNGFYYLLDINRSMYNATFSNLPNEPIGGILTLNAANTSPTNDNFAVDHVVTNNNRWDNPNAVSAHINAGIAYEYFRENFGRNSFDGKGATILSIINVAEDDGNNMDNAFWSGTAMFYGSGNVAFNRPLAASLDVASHELSHAVIERTANLVYENESGALNESFADIFGVLVDRDDWELGESVVNPNIFPTGALRSLRDPNNGGREFGDLGWQPKSTSEQYFGREDNGGVHINSGIPNHAFYLFANNPSVGKERAEQVFFRALSVYLVSSSDFKDLRLAVIQSAIDLYGNNSAVQQAAAQAFDQVGIIVEGTQSVPNTDVTTFEVNDGADNVVHFREETNQLILRVLDQDLNVLLTERGVLNVPSVSDDGRVILYIGDSGSMNAILLDWDTGDIEDITIESTLKWRNVAISKDGTKIAGVSGDFSQDEFDNRLFVADLVSDQSKWFDLTNPTYAEGVSTGDVLFADRLEWDHTGEFIMYDANNQILSLFNDPIDFWDIGFIRVWDSEENTLGDGQIFKLFPSLPEDISIGNPVFTKNSDDIIALDVIDNSTGELDYYILGVNLLTGDQGIIFDGDELGYPSYSRVDDQVIFNFTQEGVPVVAVANLNQDKISSDQAFLLIENATWGVWFGNGERNLSTSIQEPLLSEDLISLSPNPSLDFLTIEYTAGDCDECLLQLHNTNGQLMMDIQGFHDRKTLDISQLHSGTYIVTLRTMEGIAIRKFIKL